MKLHTSVDTGMMSPEETTNSSSADVENVCKRIEEDFSYPAFEIIVLIQVILPVLYSFLLPCTAAFLWGWICEDVELEELNEEDEAAGVICGSPKAVWRRKLDATLIGTWAYWYMHWELFTWFWIVLTCLVVVGCSGEMPDRYRDFCGGLAIVSAFVCYVSNLASEFRVHRMPGRLKLYFYISCALFISWTLRIVYPCFLGVGLIDDYDGARGYHDPEADQLPPPPPAYDDCVAPPPSYTETLARIRSQLPKLQRSISAQAQVWGRGMSIRKSRKSVHGQRRSLR